MSQRLEIWNVAQKWVTMDENVKEEKPLKGEEKDEINKKRRKEKIREQNSRNTFQSFIKTWNIKRILFPFYSTYSFYKKKIINDNDDK